jgi:hypothetical protein
MLENMSIGVMNAKGWEDPHKMMKCLLQPLISFEPFDKWGLEFVGPINPPSNQNNYILVCTYYLTKWVEVKELLNAKEDKVVDFLYGNIFTRFGVPREIVIDQGS